MTRTPPLLLASPILQDRVLRHPRPQRRGSAADQNATVSSATAAGTSRLTVFKTLRVTAGSGPIAHTTDAGPKSSVL